MVVAVSSLVSVAGASRRAAEEGASNSGQADNQDWAAGNPLKIALLKWYQANTTTSFAVGKKKNSHPYGVAFDGQSIWIATAAKGR